METGNLEREKGFRSVELRHSPAIVVDGLLKTVDIAFSCRENEMLVIGQSPIDNGLVRIDGGFVTLPVISAEANELILEIRIRAHIVLLCIGLVGIEERTGGKGQSLGLDSKGNALGQASFPLVSASRLYVKPGIRKQVVSFLTETENIIKGLSHTCTLDTEIIGHCISLFHNRNTSPADKHSKVAVCDKSVSLTLHIVLHLITELV